MKDINNDSISDFETAINLTLNFAIVLRGSFANLKKIADFLESQKEIKIVFSTISGDPLWVKKGGANDH
ncbi:MAG: hypothetical protein KAW45_02405 [Thermoplasmatales archaeon]|nr:hypothetical protein [Thermoplasmatales archaeon]